MYNYDFDRDFFSYRSLQEISMKLEKIRIFILQFDLENAWPNLIKICFFKMLISCQLLWQ